MGKKPHKNGWSERKLLNDILHFKSGFICQHKNIYSEDWVFEIQFKIEHFAVHQS